METMKIIDNQIVIVKAYNKYRTTLIHDKDGNLLTVLEEKLVNDIMEKYYNTTFTYDINGRRKTKIFEVLKKIHNKITEQYIYDYNDNGDMTSWILMDWKDNTWINRCRATFTYAYGQVSTKIDEDWVNNEWVMHKD